MNLANKTRKKRRTLTDSAHTRTIRTADCPASGTDRPQVTLGAQHILLVRLMLHVTEMYSKARWGVLIAVDDPKAPSSSNKTPWRLSSSCEQFPSHRSPTSTDDTTSRAGGPIMAQAIPKVAGPPAQLPYRAGANPHEHTRRCAFQLPPSAEGRLRRRVATRPRLSLPPLCLPPTCPAVPVPPRPCPADAPSSARRPPDW
jgi:hypothetical protein